MKLFSSSFDEGNDDLLSQNLDVVFDGDGSENPCGLSDDSDECSI